MRLIYHNAFICNNNGCKGKLDLDIIKKNEEFDEFNYENTKNWLKELDWKFFYKTLTNNNYLDIPIFWDENIIENKKILKKLHYFLEELIIEEGTLTCENCLSVYEIMNGIANFC